MQACKPELEFFALCNGIETSKPICCDCAGSLDLA